VDLHASRAAKTKRETHIEREGDACVLACSLRKLADGNTSILIFKQGEDSHSCQRDKLELLPWTPAELRFVLKLLMAYPSVEEIMRNVFLPAQAKCAKDSAIATRLTTMTERKLRKIARKHNIVHGVSPGTADLVAVRDVLLEMQAEGATVAYKLPGQSVDSPLVILDPNVKQYLTNRDMFLFIMTKTSARAPR
jgi:hypothetical protein